MHADHFADDGDDHRKHNPEAVDAGEQGEGQIKRAVGDDIATSLRIAPSRDFIAKSRARMPSMALAAMRRNRKTGRISHSSRQSAQSRQDACHQDRPQHSRQR